MKNSNWYVITGGPCAGKTTTIELLKEKGYTTTPETARIYFEEKMAQGIANEEIRKDPQKLQHDILDMQIALENSFDPQQLLFLDRALGDSFGYFAYHHLPLIPKLSQSNHLLYKKVFFLERVPLQQDSVRTETNEEMKRMEDCLYDEYKKLNLDIIRIPLMEKQARVDFILSHVDKE